MTSTPARDDILALALPSLQQDEVPSSVFTVGHKAWPSALLLPARPESQVGAGKERSRPDWCEDPRPQQQGETLIWEFPAGGRGFPLFLF